MSSTLRICSFGTSFVNINGGARKFIQKCSRNLLSPTLQIQTTQKATLVSLKRQQLEGNILNTVPPFPYKTKNYGWIHLPFPFLDLTHFRMNNNSKIVVIDSNMATGKADFAKKFADAFGMLYMPEPRIDDKFVNHNGFDYRTLNEYIHPKLWAFDEKMFYEDPNHPAAASMKILYYDMRYSQYIDALIHLFNTGQGVVLERSPHSDMVFTEALYRCGFFQQDVYDFYYRLRYATIHYLLRPHMIIYLDADTDLIYKRIQDRKIPYQTESKVLTKDYLNEISTAYKKYLDDAKAYSQLMVYRHQDTDFDFEDVVKDIEKLNLDDWDPQEEMFCDWNFNVNSKWHKNRYEFTSNKLCIMSSFNYIETYDVPSLDIDMNDVIHRDEVYKNFVKDYGIDPQYDSNNSFFKQLFGLRHQLSYQNFQLRYPFY